MIRLISFVKTQIQINLFEFSRQSKNYVYQLLFIFFWKFASKRKNPADFFEITFWSEKSFEIMLWLENSFEFLLWYENSNKFIWICVLTKEIELTFLFWQVKSSNFICIFVLTGKIQQIDLNFCFDMKIQINLSEFVFWQRISIWSIFTG